MEIWLSGIRVLKTQSGVAFRLAPHSIFFVTFPEKARKA